MPPLLTWMKAGAVTRVEIAWPGETCRLLYHSPVEKPKLPSCLPWQRTLLVRVHFQRMNLQWRRGRKLAQQHLRNVCGGFFFVFGDYFFSFVLLFFFFFFKWWAQNPRRLSNQRAWTPAKTLNWQPSILISMWVKCVLSNWIQALHSLQANISAFADQIKNRKSCAALERVRERVLHLCNGALILLCPKVLCLMSSSQRLCSISKMHLIMSSNVLTAQSALYKSCKYLTLAISCRKGK